MKCSSRNIWSNSNSYQTPGLGHHPSFLFLNAPATLQRLCQNLTAVLSARVKVEITSVKPLQYNPIPAAHFVARVWLLLLLTCFNGWTYFETLRSRLIVRRPLRSSVCQSITGSIPDIIHLHLRH